MRIHPDILRNIKKVMFLRNEPTVTNVMWAKPNNGQYFFFLFIDGVWQPVNVIDNVVIDIHDFSGDISSFNNDAGYLTTHQDISGKLNKSEVYYEDVYLGAGAAYTNVMVQANHYDAVLKGSVKSVAINNSYLWLILPQTYNPTILMGGMEIPVTAQSTITQGDVVYKVLKSSNSYTGTFNVILI